MSDPTPAPGWYPAPHVNNEQRYWDGSQWLENAADAPAGVLPSTPQISMSSEAIRDQLTSEYGEKFTPEEADYAISNLNN